MTLAPKCVTDAVINMFQPTRQSVLKRPSTTLASKRNIVVVFIVLCCIIVAIALYNDWNSIPDPIVFDLAPVELVLVPTSPTGMKVMVAHNPRYDLLGSFVLPTLFLYAVATYHGWEMTIIPFQGSQSETILNSLFELGNKIDEGWGSGFQDANSRKDYNPAELNAAAYDAMGFFPPTATASLLQKNWINLKAFPPADEIINVTCSDPTRTDPDANECYLLLTEDTYEIQAHFNGIGGINKVFSDSFRDKTRSKFLEVNQHRLQHFVGTYNIAIHVRRGDVLHPTRWIQQHVYAIVARQICRNHPDANVHIFSSGPNRDGNWSSLENIVNEIPDAINKEPSKCASVTFHFDELEFDSWTHMVAADALIISKSTFSYVPSLLSGGEVYFPKDYWHPPLASFHLFNSETGEIIG